jgi:hypothetical protein
LSFAVNDCLIHAINYLFYYPIFVTREQVHQLALWRKKKDASFIVDQKVSNGYSVSLFSNLVYIRGYRYAILNLMTFTADNSMPV